MENFSPPPSQCSNVSPSFPCIIILGWKLDISLIRLNNTGYNVFRRVSLFIQAKKIDILGRIYLLSASLKIFVGSSAPFYWKFIYISSKEELSIINIFSFSMKMEIFSGIQLRCQSCFVSALLYRLLGWVATDNVNTALAQGAQRMDIWQDKIYLFLFFFSWQKFHCSRPQKMCALWSKTNYGFYLLTFNHYLFRASEGKWEIGFVGICSSCSN